MAKITKDQIRDFVKAKLSSDPRWAKHALLKIYEFQTADEQASERTQDHNGIGFTGIDGEILSSFAKQLSYKGYLSPKQMTLVFKKIPKYWKQIIAISDEEKLISLIQR
jgi:hypothetical protein